MNYRLWLFILFPGICSFGQAGKIPLSLDSAIETGLKNNPEIKSSMEKIKASGGRFWSAISLPPAEISALNDYIPAGGKNLSKFGENTMGISQSIEFPSAYVFRGLKSNHEVEISKKELDLTRIKVLSRIKSAYFNALAFQDKVNIANENIAITENFAKKAEIRFSVGEGTNLEKLTANAQHTQALSDCEIKQNHLVSAYADLNFRLGFGRSDKMDFILTDSLTYHLKELSMEQLVNDANKNSPNLKINRLRLQSGSADKTLAWTSLLPEFNLGYFMKKVSEDSRNYYGASLGLSVPIWFMLDQQGKIREANANYRSVENDLKAEENAVYLTVKNAFNEFKNAEKQAALYQKDILPQSKEIYRAALKSYEAGEITYIEFLQAQQTVINAKSNYVDALLEYNLSIVALEESVGDSIQQYGAR